MYIFYPIQKLADWLTYEVLRLANDTILAEAINFFIFDTIKIFILLCVIIFCVSIIRTFLPPEKIKNILSRKGRFLGNVLAGLFGIITPFCTCSAIPLFLGFLEAGVPLGATFSFLISSPMINEVALILLFGMFGAKIAVLYISSGLVIAVVSGVIIGKLKVEDLVEHISYNKLAAGQSFLTINWRWQDRIDYAKGYTATIIKNIWPYLFIAIGIGAWIHGYVPSDFLAKYASADKWYAVPVATLIGIPLYSNVAGVIPLVSVLTEKGVSMGTTLSFMMAVTALSLPEFMILKKVMKIKLLAIFAGIVGMGIIFTGYLFNFIIK
ncbi:MAG: permease [Candidatus Omnitrophica bacterium]|nr:permease [Candidatus Omnitrophota bacterium]HOX54582.1 permease [Candidatus Omnitrophota bacterium]